MMMISLRDELAGIEAQEKALAARKREIYAASLEAPADEKVIGDWMAGMLSEPSLFKSIEYPISVMGINYEPGEVWRKSFGRVSVGDFVKVRPCDEECKGRTYLGIYLGDVALSVGHSYHVASGVLNARIGHHNPAMYVPSLKRVVLGCGSWWGRIESPDELKAITDQDIATMPYVELLKAQVGDPGAFDATKPAEQLAAECVKMVDIGDFRKEEVIILKDGDKEVCCCPCADDMVQRKDEVVAVLTNIINRARGKSTT